MRARIDPGTIGGLFNLAGWICVIAAALACLGLLMALSPAHARDNGQWTNSAPQTREWFLAQSNPKTGVPCCTNADGVNAEEEQCPGGDVVLHPEFKCPPGDENIWVKFVAVSGGQYGDPVKREVDWMIVPPDSILETSRGVATVWWYHDNGQIFIRCFARGPRS